MFYMEAATVQVVWPCSSNFLNYIYLSLSLLPVSYSYFKLIAQCLMFFGEAIVYFNQSLPPPPKCSFLDNKGIIVLLHTRII